MASGFLDSLRASGWSKAVGTEFAKKTLGIVAFGVLSGGVGSALSGGNFWQGFVIGGTVAGLNDAMHNEIDEDAAPDNGYDENGKKISNKGGNQTDYLYSDGKIVSSTSVEISYTSFNGDQREGYSYRVRYSVEGRSPALTDPTWEMLGTVLGPMRGIKLVGKLSLNYFNQKTGGFKQWIRFAGDSYSISGDFHTFGTRWGAGRNY